MENKNSNGSFEITVKAVLLNNDNEALILKRSDSDKLNPGKYDLPGGYVQENEELAKALIREIKEEVGLDAEVGPVLHAFDFKGGNGKGFRFLAFCKEGEIIVDKNEVGGYEWLSLDKAIDKFSENDYESDKKEALRKVKEYLEMKNALSGWKRSLADFENYKKQQEDSRKDLIRYSTENIVLQMIPILDNFHSSTDHVPEDQKNNPWVMGIMYIQKQMEDVLRENGVEEIELAVGGNFDPKFHEAVGEADCDCHSCDCEKEKKKFQNKIKKIIQKGYRIEEKVVRPARVVVE